MNNLQDLNLVLFKQIERLDNNDLTEEQFRRTCATNALKNGMPVEMVSKMLGHDNIGTTQIYLDINDDDMAAMHKRYVR